MLHRHFWCVVKEGLTQELQLRDPLQGLPGLQALVHEAHKADGRRGVRVQQLTWVVGFEGFYQAGHAFGCELGELVREALSAG